MNPLNIVGEVISQGVGYFKDKQQAKHDRHMAVEQRKTDLAKGTQSHNHTWELEALREEGLDIVIARLYFIAFYSIPLAITVIKPSVGTAIWVSLNIVPAWVIGVIVTMTGWAFAAKPLQRVGAGLVGSKLKFKSTDV